MKKNKLTAITCMLAAATVTAALGGAALGNTTKASAATAQSYSLTTVFNATRTDVIGYKTLGEGESAENVTAFTLANEQEAYITRSVALKWYEANSENATKGDLKYFTTKFALMDTNFTEFTFSMDTKSAWTTENNKSTNTVVFKKQEDGSLKVFVGETDTQKVIPAADAKADMTLALGEATNATDGSFTVKLTVNGTEYELDSFENIGANYAEYAYSSERENALYPFSFKATLPKDDQADNDSTVVLLKEINGQDFTGITEDKKVKDTAQPVVVVNEKVDGFLLGTQFALDCIVLDVLDSTTTKALDFYQYNPTVESGKEEYKDLSTSTYFLETVYYEKNGEPVAADTEGATATSVFKKDKKEYVSIRIKAGDDTYKKVDETKDERSVVYLDWWYEGEDKASLEKDGKQYLPVDKNEEGAKYNEKWITRVDDENSSDYATNGFDESFWESQEYKDFKKALDAEAKKTHAGSNASINLPSFKWLIDDNNGYRQLKFTISYKTPASTSASNSSSLSYSALKFSVSQVGQYEFKIFANDRLGNTMQYYLDGELVEVTSSNVWEIEEIPSFTFNIEYNGLTFKEENESESERKDSEVLDKTYSMDTVSVVGATTLKEDYALYKMDFEKFNGLLNEKDRITKAKLYSVKFSSLASQIKLGEVNKYESYFDLYLETYVKAVLGDAVASQLNADQIKALKNCFTQIKVKEDCATQAEWDAFEKYQWSPTSKSFKTVEEGNFLILADYWEKDLPTQQRVMAYKFVNVQSKADTVTGDKNSEWLKNNVVSVVLFAIAGVMLILIIILLLVKPSDEKLEDVDKDTAKAKKGKDKTKDHKVEEPKGESETETVEEVKAEEEK